MSPLNDIEKKDLASLRRHAADSVQAALSELVHQVESLDTSFDYSGLVDRLPSQLAGLRGLAQAIVLAAVNLNAEASACSAVVDIEGQFGDGT
jgi:hypothetical protein